MQTSGKSVEVVEAHYWEQKAKGVGVVDALSFTGVYSNLYFFLSGLYAIPNYLAVGRWI